MKRCKHQNADHLTPEHDGVAVETFRCLDCGEYLSLGTAYDIDAVEIRLAAFLAENVALALDSDEPTITLAGKDAPVSPRTCFIALLEGFKNNGLTNPLNVPALSGKKPKAGDEPDEDDMDAEEFKAYKVKKILAADPKKPMAQAIHEAEKAVKERAKAKK